MTYMLDCEQSLSFPSVFLAFLRASVELWSSKQHNFDELCARRISGTKTDYSNGTYMPTNAD